MATKQVVRSTDRILTTHVGSLIRPPDLVAMLAAKLDGVPVDEKAYQECLHNSVAEVVREQARIGIDIIGDGEFGKGISWARYILERLSGFEYRPEEGAAQLNPARGKDARDFADFYKEYETALGGAGIGKKGPGTIGWVVTGPIAYTGQAAIGRDLANFKDALKGVEVTGAFVPAVSPASVVPGRTDKYYKTEKDGLFALADALHDEYKAITDAGFTVQVDDSHFATYYDFLVPPHTLADYRKWAAERVEAINHALRGIPEEQSRYHVCWGSWNGPHTNDVATRDMIDLVLDVKCGSYSLEMANPRHEHEWRVWETVKLPEGKVLQPGVISHATNVVEHPELVAERIVRLARLVGRENVVASTDCGFAQGPFARRVHPSIMWAKLGSLVEGAKIASRELWRA